MPGFMPGIHVFAAVRFRKTWMAGTSPAMTDESLGHRCADLCLWPLHVMPGFMPGIHVFTAARFGKTWMASEVGLA